MIKNHARPKQPPAGSSSSLASRSKTAGPAAKAIARAIASGESWVLVLLQVFLLPHHPKNDLTCYGKIVEYRSYNLHFETYSFREVHHRINKLR